MRIKLNRVAEELTDTFAIASLPHLLKLIYQKYKGHRTCYTLLHSGLCSFILLQYIYYCYNNNKKKTRIVSIDTGLCGAKINSNCKPRSSSTTISNSRTIWRGQL
ncbi:hypothetical protein PUN28_012321 [Cardiocondyla obscurior]|uniref:Uncharacterized protein n=1 Tax=Cardiocondyla obscurior TaxID=286306 RepID=A0AAW2FAM8_9HYME